MSYYLWNWQYFLTQAKKYFHLVLRDPVLVALGQTSTGYTSEVELFDFGDPTRVCNVPNLPRAAGGATGIDFVICGGHNETDYTDECHMISQAGTWEPYQPMPQKRLNYIFYPRHLSFSLNRTLPKVGYHQVRYLQQGRIVPYEKMYQKSVFKWTNLLPSRTHSAWEFIKDAWSEPVHKIL